MTTIARKAAEEIASLIAVGIEWDADPEIERQSVTAIIQRAIDASHEWQPPSTCPDWSGPVLARYGSTFAVVQKDASDYWLYGPEPGDDSFVGVDPPDAWMPLPAPPKGDAT